MLVVYLNALGFGDCSPEEKNLLNIYATSKKLFQKDEGKDGIVKSLLSYDFSKWDESSLKAMDYMYALHRIFWKIYWDELDRIYCDYYAKSYLSPINFCELMKKDIIAMKDLFWYAHIDITEFHRNYCKMINENNRNELLILVKPILENPICDA